jgi:hypothetical protein
VGQRRLLKWNSPYHPRIRKAKDRPKIRNVKDRPWTRNVKDKEQEAEVQDVQNQLPELLPLRRRTSFRRTGK